jgi:protein subunit release factor A
LPPSPRQLETGITVLRARLDRLVSTQHFVTLVVLKEALLAEMLQPSFWDDQDHAHTVNRTIYHLDRVTKRLQDLQRRAETFALPEGLARRDAGRITRLAARYHTLENEVALAELQLLATEGLSVSTTGVCLRIVALSQEEESISPSWPLVLLGMYEGWAQCHGYEVETEAGAVALVTMWGGNLAGILQGEAGVHKRRTLVVKGNTRHSNIELARVDVLPLSSDGSAEDHVVGTTDASEVVRLYCFARSHYVRDPRTGERSNRAREVLKGEIDAFLLTYLAQRLPKPLAV